MEIQKAGDNAQQIQIQNLNFGIDEKRAREIYDEKYCIAKRDFTEEALRIANERVKELENRLIPKMQTINDGLKAFADPSFQLLLVEAQKTAAATERPVDYDLLSELLIHRINKGNDRHIRTGIHRAVEIVEDISDEALLGLTVVHSLSSLIPIASNVYSALEISNNLFGKIIYGELPSGNEWIDHLDILDAVRVNQFGRFKSIEEGYTDALNGIFVIGIKKESEEYNKAKDILQKSELPLSVLTENPLHQDFMRINVGRKEDIDNLQLIHIINGNISYFPLSSEQKIALKSIFELYSQDVTLSQEIKNSFINEWMKYPNLAKLKNWWEKLPYSFSVTSVGKVLAHANAQRCDNTLPPLN